jgi:hypothetical protein
VCIIFALILAEGMSCFPIKTLCARLLAYIRATGPAHLILPLLIILIFGGDIYIYIYIYIYIFGGW